jgi:DNA repair exonuclease SbcCD nuclease subunit
LHLDAPFQGIGAEDTRVGSELVEATYRAFGKVVDTCLERSADFLVIAGDAYNSADKSLRAQLRFRREMERLAEAGIRVFVAHGNHDPASGWSAGLELPDNTHVFPTGQVGRFEVERDGELVAAVYGRSFGKAAETSNFASEYIRDAKDPVAVAVLHANVGGNPDHDPYAPASIDDLRASRMDYWALGHIHKQEILSRDPWVVYSGSPQGLNPKELGPHGCLVVEIGANGSVTTEHVECAPIAWGQLRIDLGDVGSLDQLHEVLADACGGARMEAGRPVIARIVLEGRSSVHFDLARSGVAVELLEDLRPEQSALDPWLWIDRLDDKTSPAIDLDAVRSGLDFSSELARIADELASDPEALAAFVREIEEPVATTLGGYKPGLSEGEVVSLARDLALDLLLAEGGDAR